MSKKIVLVFCVIIALAFTGYFWQKNKKNTNQNNGKVLANKERNLTAEQKQIYLDRIQKAEADLRGLNPTDANYHISQINDHMYLGQQYFGLGQMEKSKQEFLTVLQIEPNYEPAFAALALTYSDAGELPEAQLALESAIKSNSKNYNIWLQYIGVRQAMGASNEELGQLYEDALLATSRYTDILTKYAQFEESVGNIAEAIALWEEALKNYPENAQFYNTEINRLKKLK